PPRRIPTYWLASRRRYFRKNHGPAYALSADLAWAAAFALWRLRRRVQRKPDTDPPHLPWDFVRFNLLGRPGARPPPGPGARPPGDSSSGRGSGHEGNERHAGERDPAARGRPE